MKKMLLMAMALTTAGVAFAGGSGAPAATPAPVMNKEIFVPGTKVSYILSRTDGANTSSMYVTSTVSPDIYVEFACVRNAPMFFLNMDREVLTQDAYHNDELPDLTYQADQLAARTLMSVRLNESDDPEDTGHLTTLAVEDANDPVIFNAFRSSKNQVTMRFVDSAGKPVNLTFPTKGFEAGWKAINGCK